MKILDTHTHVLSSSYKDELDNVIKRVDEENVVAFNISFDLKSSKEVLSLYKSNKHLIPVIGFHPSDIKGWNKNKLNAIEELINDDVAAIGEIGLDYHYEGFNKEEQAKAFVDQIELAIKYDLPIVVHTRDSLKDCYEIIKNYPEKKFLLHSWSGDIEMTKKYMSISDNIYFSYNGIITFKNAPMQREVIKEIRLDRLMFETDCPYLSPMPYRGATNYPWRVKEVIDFVANHLGMTFDELNVNNNKVALDFYNIDKEQIN